MWRGFVEFITQPFRKFFSLTSSILRVLIYCVFYYFLGDLSWVIYIDLSTSQWALLFTTVSLYSPILRTLFWFICFVSFTPFLKYTPQIVRVNDMLYTHSLANKCAAHGCLVHRELQFLWVIGDNGYRSHASEQGSLLWVPHRIMSKKTWHQTWKETRKTLLTDPGIP